VPTVSRCTFPECPGTLYCKGLCRGHYAQQERGEALHPTKAMAPTVCRMDDCPEPVFTKSRALCRIHYWRWQHGTLEPTLPRPCRNCGEDFRPVSQRNAQNCSRDCAIESARLRQKYGITGLEVLAMLDAQDHKCAICSTSIIRGRRGAGLEQHGLHIDHCHDTGKVRGLLCGYCNRALGQFRDSLEILEAAVKYLELSR